jgi:hypothetical protein
MVVIVVCQVHSFELSRLLERSMPKEPNTFSTATEMHLGEALVEDLDAVPYTKEGIAATVIPRVQGGDGV